MKTIVIVALAALLIALVLPLVLTALSPAAAVSTAAPQSSQTSGADASSAFTVLTDGQVETVTMAQWLPGALAGEMPALFETEALKAQAVAARSYILSRRTLGVSNHPEADICDDPYCCKAHLSEDELRARWGSDYDAYWQRMVDAVAATDGEYLTYGGAPIQAVFHSSSAGATEDASAVWSALPYLKSVSSPETALDVPDYVTTVTVTELDFAAGIRELYPEMELAADPSAWLGDISVDGSGRVSAVRIGAVSVTGAELRQAFSLRSTAFTLEHQPGSFVFTVTGYGHGVGLSQYGANVMARSGSDYREILLHYYSGTELTAG